jgi:hypothetical protein
MKKKKCANKKKCAKKMCVPKKTEIQQPQSIPDQVFAMIGKWFNKSPND